MLGSYNLYLRNRKNFFSQEAEQWKIGGGIQEKHYCYFTGKVKGNQSEGVRAHLADEQNRTEDSASSAAH